MSDKSQMTWIKGGTALTSAFALLFLVRGKWRLARLAGGLAAAFLLKWRENRLAGEVGQILSQAGRKP